MSILDALRGLPVWLVLAAVFLLPALEASMLVGVIVPGETAAVVGGALAQGGRPPLWGVMLAAAAGAMAGDNVGYQIGRRFGPAVLNRLPPRLAGSAQLRRGLDLVRRRGAAAVVLGRWTAALRALVPGIAGMSGLSYRTFAAANVFGSASWASTVTLLGFLAGAGYRSLEHRLGLGEAILFLALTTLAAAGVVRSRRRHLRATTSDGGNAAMPAPPYPRPSCSRFDREHRTSATADDGTWIRAVAEDERCGTGPGGGHPSCVTWSMGGRQRHMDADAMDLDEFERLVSQALADMPEWVQRAVADVAILVDDEAPADWNGDGLLLGQFHGVARTRGARASGSLPDRIELYRIPILRVCSSPEDVAARVRKVLGHEIGHAFGLGDARLRDLGWY